MNISRINPELLRLAKVAVDRRNQKQAFVAAGDPAMDPMAAGDPAAGGGGGDPMAALVPVIQQIVQQQMQQMGGAAGAAGGAAGAGGVVNKPKIDINIEIMQMKKMMAKIIDALGVQMPASEMVATPEDLDQMAAEQQGGAPAAGGAPQGGAIPPIGPITPMKAAVWEQGVAFAPPTTMHAAHETPAQRLSDLAQAILLQHSTRRS